MSRPLPPTAQPGAFLLREQGWSLRGLALRMGVKYTHLSGVMRGHTVPSPRIREQLPQLTGIPLEKLFTPEMLSRKYSPRGTRSGNLR